MTSVFFFHGLSNYKRTQAAENTIMTKKNIIQGSFTNKNYSNTFFAID